MDSEADSEFPEIRDYHRTMQGRDGPVDWTTLQPSVLNLFQSTRDKRLIPAKVFDNIRRVAPEYNYYLTDDADVKAFFRHAFSEAEAARYIAKFDSMRYPPNKADLFRYAVLFTHGGVWLDIDVEPMAALRHAFPRRDSTFYTALDWVGNATFQAIISVPPGHELMLAAAQDLREIEMPPDDNLFPCRRLWTLLRERFVDEDARETESTFDLVHKLLPLRELLENDNPPSAYGSSKKSSNVKSSILTSKKGEHGRHGSHAQLLVEKCIGGEDPSCEEPDEYGLCCEVRDAVEDGEVLFRSRYPEYPWY